MNRRGFFAKFAVAAAAVALAPKIAFGQLEPTKPTLLTFAECAMPGVNGYCFWYDDTLPIAFMLEAKPTPSGGVHRAATLLDYADFRKGIITPIAHRLGTL